jgi:hypothetical protein
MFGRSTVLAFSEFVYKYGDIIPKVHGCFHKSYFESFIYLCDLTALGHLMMHSHCKKQSKETVGHGDRFNNVKI